MYSSAKQELQPVEQRGEGPKLENDFSIIFHIIIIALALTIRHLHGSSKWFVVMMIAVVFCCCYFAIVWHGRLILTWRNHLAFVASRSLGNHRERQDTAHWLAAVCYSIHTTAYYVHGNLRMTTDSITGIGRRRAVAERDENITNAHFLREHTTVHNMYVYVVWRVGT